MVNLSANLVKVEIVDLLSDSPEHNDSDCDISMACDSYAYGGEEKNKKSMENPSNNMDDRPEKRFGIRVTFSQKYSSKHAVRIRATAHGQLYAEKLVENQQIHNVDGHTMFEVTKCKCFRSGTPCPEDDSAECDSELHPPSQLYDPALVGTIAVTLTEIKNIHYYSTPKAHTYLRHEAMVASAKRTMGSAALAFRVPLEQLVDCGHGSMSYDYVHEVRRPFATFHFQYQALGGEVMDVLNRSEDVMSRPELQTLMRQLKTQDWGNQSVRPFRSNK